MGKGKRRVEGKRPTGRGADVGEEEVRDDVGGVV